MKKVGKVYENFSTPEGRWARFGPYYAMFPVEFAFDVISKYSKKDDYIIDPFSGRGSSIYAGGVLGRNSLGIEINPIGWIYSKVKINPANSQDVVQRLKEVYEDRINFKNQIAGMPEFFQMCYCKEVLLFLLSVRNNLDWSNEDNIIDSTLMSIVLVYLHGKLGEGLSNQMRMTKSMGMKYSIEWWRNNNMSSPPEINPYSFILKRINWRYEKGMPNVPNSNVIFGDSTIKLREILPRSINQNIKFSLLFTSPPYCKITDYHVDQWLRLWLLGGFQGPLSLREKHKGRFRNKEEYYELLDNVFGLCSQMMKSENVVYIRTDKRDFTFNSNLEILTKHFPNHKLQIIDKPLTKFTKTQTQLFGDKSLKPGEMDIILTST